MPRVHPALVLAEPAQRARGAAIKLSRPVRSFLGQSAATAPLFFRGVAGPPAEADVEETACGVRPGRILPPNVSGEFIFIQLYYLFKSQ
jgi:hypothetical protein